VCVLSREKKVKIEVAIISTLSAMTSSKCAVRNATAVETCETLRPLTARTRERERTSESSSSSSSSISFECVRSFDSRARNERVLMQKTHSRVPELRARGEEEEETFLFVLFAYEPINNARNFIEEFLFTTRGKHR
jgi:hypothetical protein